MQWSARLATKPTTTTSRRKRESLQHSSNNANALDPQSENSGRSKASPYSDLAQRTGISVSYLSRLEQGRSVPAFTLLSKLGQELGVDIGYFVETEQTARTVDDELAEALSHTSIPKKVWPEILGLSLEGRKAIADYLKQQVQV
jgi:transcriptional regulator with XRE-family HTH domain